MKKILCILLSALLGAGAAFGLAACANSSATDNRPEVDVTGESGILVAYFSWSGNTRQVARWIAEKTGGEIFRILPEEAYPEDYSSTADRARQELNSGTRPPLAEHIDAAIMEGVQYRVLRVPHLVVRPAHARMDVFGRIRFFRQNGYSVFHARRLVERGGQPFHGGAAVPRCKRAVGRLFFVQRRQRR